VNIGVWRRTVARDRPTTSGRVGSAAELTRESAFRVLSSLTGIGVRTAIIMSSLDSAHVERPVFSQTAVFFGLRLYIPAMNLVA